MQLRDQSTIPHMDDTQEHLTRKQKEENRLLERVVQKLLKQSLATREDGANGLETADLGRFVTFMESVKFIAGSALVAGMVGSIYEYLSLMGVSEVSPARVVLICAWFFGAIFIYQLVTSNKWRPRKRWLAGVSLAIALGIGLFVMDKITISWRIHHPSEISQVSESVHHLQEDFEILKLSSGKKTTVTQDQSGIKYISAVPGYLQITLGFTQLPLVQASEPVMLNVFFYNRGSTYVHHATMTGAFFLVDFSGRRPTPAQEEQVKSRINAVENSVPPQSDNDVAPGEAVWNTYTTAPIDSDTVMKIRLGTARLYLGTRASWTVGNTADHVDECAWLEPTDLAPGADPSKARPLLHIC